MVSLTRAAFDRLGPWPVFAAFAAIGCGAWALALVTLVPFVRAVQARAPLLALNPHDSIGLPIGMAFFAIAAITVIPTPRAGANSRQAAGGGRPPRRTDWPALLLCAAAAFIALTFLAAPITQFVVSAVVEARGYRPCPMLDDERHQSLRWVSSMLGKPTPRCPADWRQARQNAGLP